MMSFKRGFIILLIFLNGISGCAVYQTYMPDTSQSANERHQDELIQAEKSILSRINNTDNADSLIKTSYPENSLLKYCEKFMSILDIDMECKIECIRKIGDDQYYTLHRSDNGGILYLLFARNDKGILQVNDNTSYIMQSQWYVSKEICISDFERLDINSSTVDDVKAIDLYGSYTTDFAPYRGAKLEQEMSEHFTTDGYTVLIKYVQNTDGVFVVAGISIEPAGNTSLYSKILPADRPKNLIRKLDGSN